MELFQVLITAEKHMSEARLLYNNDKKESAVDELADLAGLIQREIVDIETHTEEPEIEEPVPTPPGRCVPDQVQEVKTESEETQQKTGEGTPSNKE